MIQAMKRARSPRIDLTSFFLFFFAKIVASHRNEIVRILREREAVKGLLVASGRWQTGVTLT